MMILYHLHLRVTKELYAGHVAVGGGEHDPNYPRVDDQLGAGVAGRDGGEQLRLTDCYPVTRRISYGVGLPMD
jgi:hypothetical protein